MIKDCFSYFNEKELLELRINLLKDHVDEFVICEADRTHSGKPKELTVSKIIDELGLPRDKIRIVTVHLPSKEEEGDDYNRERMQRNAAANYIGYDDLAFVSDCDEIMDPSFIAYYAMIAKGNPNSILRLPMAFLMGKANLRAHDVLGQPIGWSPGFVCMGHHKEKYTLSEIRESQSKGLFNVAYKDIFTVDEGVVKDAGWHFSYLGGYEMIKTKIESFAHTEFYTPEINNNLTCSPCVRSSVAVFFSLRPMPKCFVCGLKPSLLAVFYIQDSVHPLSESTFFEDQ